MEGVLDLLSYARRKGRVGYLNTIGSLSFIYYSEYTTTTKITVSFILVRFKKKYSA